MLATDGAMGPLGLACLVRALDPAGEAVRETEHFEMYPELGYTVVILSNFDDDPRAIASKLREWLTQGVRPR
ncbi:hypothetical protein OV079_03190 [Nannocystis pusilla]|uniref:Uncharacterized protein n=1 Tax=Nannocystis pusilla TaxID=889268 RepID=A0A9X3EK01_9BACT|nr:hypothetical protein [Nannocystis pusilla]MCY1004590.1 hypothetical protein [Nannocystis pusilla]